MSLDKVLNNDRYLVYFKQINIMSIYDSYRYSYNDYNVVSLSQRNYLIKRLKNYSFKQVSGQVLTDNQQNIIFLKSSSLGVSPLIEFERAKSLVKHHNDIIVLTPLTAALVICDQYLLADLAMAMSKIESLISKCPINLEQFEIFSRGTEFHKKLKENIEQIELYQKKIIKEKFEGRTIKLS